MVIAREHRSSKSAARCGRAWASAVTTLLAIGGLAVVPQAVPVVHAAAATVGNGLTTTDLAAVGMSPASLAAALVGPGVTVSNVTFTGANAQAGLIHLTDRAVVSFNDGIILSSGNVADVLGPNKSDGITGDMAGGADADLDQLIKDTQTVFPSTFDAVTLEFDFVPAGSTVYFTYTFGSDEYLEWVNLYNDVFAFFVNGVNCATTPSGAPITIDTINDVVNPTLFRDNSFSNPPANPINIESDGLSVELICSAPVHAGQTNHMKLALADTSDQILDSVVMIKADSLSTIPPESCNDLEDNDSDGLIDLADDFCTTTTSPPPTGSSGVGSGSSAPPFTGNEGTPIVLDASALGWTPSNDTLTTTWTVEPINGTVGSCEVLPAGAQPLAVDGSPAVVTAYCDSEGEYTARIEGWDVESKSAWDTDVDFFVHNAPPAVSLDAPLTGDQVDMGVSLDLSAAVSDAGNGDTSTCSISWGDGASEEGTIDVGVCTASHSYSTSGKYLVSVTSADNSGAMSAAAAMIEVLGAGSNTAPVVSVSGPFSGNEGSPITITGSASDVDGDSLTTSWVVTANAGAQAGAACVIADATAITTTVTCNDNATFTATLSASDSLASTDASGTLTTTNVAPTATITTPTASALVGVGVPVSFAATLADKGSNDTLTCTVAWGDGSANTSGTVVSGTCSASHSYAAVSSRTITVTVRDDESSTGTATRSVSVVAAPTITSFSPLKGGVGTAVTITGTNFTGATAVRFSTASATKFRVLNSTTIIVGVPAGANSGRITVVTPGGVAVSKTNFTVAGGALPTITSFTPSSGPAGTQVTLRGVNVGAAVMVTLNGKFVSYSVSSASSIVITIPAGASTGRFKVVTAGGSATSATNFTVL